MSLVLGRRRCCFSSSRVVARVVSAVLLLLMMSGSNVPVLRGVEAAAAAFVVPPPPSFHHQGRRSTKERGVATTKTATSIAAKKYQKVFVAGGTRGVGKHVIEQLLDKGKDVVALVRSPDSAEELRNMDGVAVKMGDAFVIKDVENAMDGCDAAITTLGGSSLESDENQKVDYVGNNHVIESAGILGVTRVLLVTSIGCGNSQEAAPPSVFEALKPVLMAKTRAETVLQKYYTNTDWTIIRPGGLKSEPATNSAILTEDHTVIGSIHREDVASLIAQALDSPNCIRKTLSAIDPTLTTTTSSSSVEGGGSESGEKKKSVEAFAL